MHPKGGKFIELNGKVVKFGVVFIGVSISLFLGFNFLTEHDGFDPNYTRVNTPRPLRKQDYCRCPEAQQCPKASLSSSMENQFVAYHAPMRSSGPKCPEWFKFIKEDLKPWRDRGGISEEAITGAILEASFRAKIIGGKLYIETYMWCFQTRSIFTIWGIVQLLKRFPGQVPDVDFMFQCEDFPSVHAPAYGRTTHPPLLLKYCRPNEFLDVLWPDWTFWGWAELHMDEWEPLRDRIVGNSSKIPYAQRDKFAFWKGVTGVAPEIRGELVKCDDEPIHKWGIVAKETDWEKELDTKETLLETQCNHRYKIFCEGRSWSVSLKYILACGSTPILIHPINDDFYSRGLIKGVHYLEVPHPKDANVCESINEVVKNGTSNLDDMKKIGQAAQKFVQEDLAMARVYDYMLLLLQEYASLQLFTPRVHPNSSFELVTDEWLAEKTPDDAKNFMVDSQEKGSIPCSMP